MLVEYGFFGKLLQIQKSVACRSSTNGWDLLLVAGDSFVHSFIINNNLYYALKSEDAEALMAPG